MIAELFKQLAISKVRPGVAVVAVFIASEENTTIPDVGIDAMQKAGQAPTSFVFVARRVVTLAAGELEHLKSGPVIWVDSANFGPTLGTAGVLQWQIDLTGKLFHSGLPHKAINCIELAAAVLQNIQKRVGGNTWGFSANHCD